MRICWRSNLSNDVIISVYVNMYVAFCDLLQIWKRVWQWHFLVWNGARFFWEPGVTTHQKFLGAPPGPTNKLSGAWARWQARVWWADQNSNANFPLLDNLRTVIKSLIYFSHFIGILRDELRTRPKAVDHLSKYLKEHYDYTELTELYR